MEGSSVRGRDGGNHNSSTNININTYHALISGSPSLFSSQTTARQPISSLAIFSSARLVSSVNVVRQRGNQTQDFPNRHTIERMHCLCYGRLALGVALPTIAIYLTPKDEDSKEQPTKTIKVTQTTKDTQQRALHAI
jgi:hypothetical protein